MWSVIFAAALVDAAGIGSILPFVAILSDPALIYNNWALQFVHEAFGSPPTNKFLIYVGLIVLTIFLMSCLLRACVAFFQFRFAYLQEKSISTRLMKSYLGQPYEWFLDQHSSNLSKSILSEVNAVVVHGYLPLVQLLSHTAVAMILLIAIFSVDPMSSLVGSTVIISCYAGLYSIVRRPLKRMGYSRSAANQTKFKSVSDAFTGVKDIKAMRLEPQYAARFQAAASTYASNHIWSLVIGRVPTFAVEGIVFGLILSMLLFLIDKPGGFEKAIPVLAFYILAGYRLLPAIQQIYKTTTNIKFIGPAINDLRLRLTSLDKSTQCLTSNKREGFKTSIIMDNVSHRYLGASSDSLTCVNLQIFKGQAIGIVGGTGSGKTTLVDILIGLLKPSHGQLCIDDDVVSNADVFSPSLVFGYVPQDIFLVDGTIAHNIALSTTEDEVDFALLKRSCSAAGISEFIEHQLKEKYQTTVGERGIRLSGGQRQRIGIARALYRQPDVLVFDEATSALDGVTERTVMDQIRKLPENMTIVMIAHRLNTIKHCDNIYLLERGRVSASGKYEELKNMNPSFQLLVANS